MQKQEIIISNIFVGATEPECETHNSCGFNDGRCQEIETHRWITALNRGQQMKSGIKIVDLMPDEINAFIEVCKEYIRITNSWAMGDRDEAEAAQPVNRAMKRLLNKLQTFKTTVEG